MDENFDFDSMPDLEPKTVRGIKYRGKSYVLRTASAGAGVKFKNARLRALRMDDGKLVAFEGAADVEPLLVSLCVFELVRTEDGREVEKPVDEAVVRGWPGEMVKKLFDKAMELSPFLEDSPTVDGLTKEIARLTTRLESLKKGKGEDDRPFDSPPNGKGP